MMTKNKLAGEQVLNVFNINKATKIMETTNWKFMRGDVNFNFNKNTGFMQRWGETQAHDPDFAPCPEILDIEITTKCNGPANKLCGFCYKSNNPNGHNMTLDQFKNIIDKMPFLTQCALGADAQGITNPDMFPMMEYARSKGIMPNLTIASTNDGKMYLDDCYHDRDQTAKIVIRRKKIES